MCFWGHPSTTGLSSMDYFLSSDVFEQHDSFRYSEQLIRFSSLSFVFPTPQFDTSPFHFDQFSADSALYLIPQTLPKFHPAFDYVLREILRRDQSDSFIVIVFDREKRHWKNLLQQRLEISGIDIERVKFIPSLARDQFAALVQRSTLLLDPFPFGGGVTSLEAFHFCKPVVTLPSRQSVVELTAGMLRHMNISDLIAENPDELVQIAIRIRESESYRSNLESRICESRGIIHDNQQFVGEFEQFVRSSARRH